MYIKFLQDLISFPSVTPSSNGSIEYISDLLERNDFKTETKIFGEDNYKVTNLYAVYGEVKPNICFAGHVDVVPIVDRSLWLSDPFEAHIIDDKIYGRGVVDMKGAIACFLAASLDFIKLNSTPHGAISLLITSDEEGPAKYGIAEMLKYLHKDTDKLIDLAIIGEPTSRQQVGDTVKIGRRGSVNFNLAIYGTAGHVAYPLMAKNPLPYLVEILNILAHHQLDVGSKFFQQSNLEITSIDVGNNVGNVIPGKASARFNIRFNDLHSSASIIALLNSIISEYLAKDALKYELTGVSSADCFIQEPIGLIADFVQVVETTTKIATDLSTDGGTSDARFIKNYCPVVEFGLRSGEAHKINECTKIIDLQTLYRVYYDSLIKFLN